MEQLDSTKRKRKKIINNKGNPNIDRISDLPEPILHHILSFLHMVDVVRTCVLSTKWRYVWKSFPCLIFDDNPFDSTITKKSSEVRFKHFVDEVLLRDTSNIQSFHFSIPHRIFEYYDLTSPIESWILFALRRNVQQLYLNLPHIRFQWPSCLFNCRSLTTLGLHKSFGLITLPDSMCLPNLKTLAFSKLHFEGDDDVPNKIFSSCPVLESLSLTNCEFDKTNLEFCSLKLKHLVIENCVSVQRKGYTSSIKFNAPNLISFRCKGYIWEGYSIEKLSALLKADIDMDVICNERLGSYWDEMTGVGAQLMIKFLRVFHKVKDLTLSKRFLKNVSGARALIEMEPNQFSNLRYMKLITSLSRSCVNAITYLLEVSPNIESLLLEMIKDAGNSYPKYPYWDKVSSNSEKIEVYQNAVLSLSMLYHLKLVKIRDVEGRLNELMFLEALLKNSPVLEKVVLYASEIQSPYRKSRLMKFTEHLRSLPRASSRVTILLV